MNKKTEKNLLAYRNHQWCR